MHFRLQNKCYSQRRFMKLDSILAVVNLLAQNNISQICYCGQISLLSAAVNCSFSDNLTSLGVTFILLAMVLVQGVHKNYETCKIRKITFFSLLLKENELERKRIKILGRDKKQSTTRRTIKLPLGVVE